MWGGIASEPKNKRGLHSVVWSGKDDAAGLFYLKSADLGEHWSVPVRIGDGRSRESDIAILRNGQIGVVFVAPAGDGEGLQFISSTDQGNSWSPPKQLSAPGSNADHPRILSIPTGFRVFWTEKNQTVEHPVKRGIVTLLLSLRFFIKESKANYSGFGTLSG